MLEIISYLYLKYHINNKTVHVNKPAQETHSIYCINKKTLRINFKNIISL